MIETYSKELIEELIKEIDTDQLLKLDINGSRINYKTLGKVKLDDEKLQRFVMLLNKPSTEDTILNMKNTLREYSIAQENNGILNFSLSFSLIDANFVQYSILKTYTPNALQEKDKQEGRSITEVLDELENMIKSNENVCNISISPLMLKKGKRNTTAKAHEVIKLLKSNILEELDGNG